MFDEAFVAVGARDMLQNKTPMWDAISNAPFVWLIAHLLGSRGIESAFLLRFPAVLIGTASIIPVYFLARRLFDTRIAALAAFLFASHPFAIAFSRVLFADPFQVFFILVGWLAFDHYATLPWQKARKYPVLLLLIALIWSMAFLMKYNAVVPGAIWIIAGVLAGRYYLSSALLSLIAMTLGALLTLALWPYDAPVWLAAFLEKGGSYDLRFAASYFESKLHLVLYGLTEVSIVTGLIIGYFKRGCSPSSFAQLALFLLIYLAMVIVLGRTFERYLLITVPVACMFVAGLLLYLFRIARKFKMRSHRMTASILVGCAAVVFAAGTIQSSLNYYTYLHNDIDQAALARDAIALERNEHAGFWLITEPVAAYYLGYTRYYSRSTLGESYYSDHFLSNYFEGQPVLYEQERVPYGVLGVRRLLRSWGFARVISSPAEFLDSARDIVKSTHDMPKKPAVDYLTDTLVKPGSLLVIKSGFRDMQGEPILEDIRKKSGPPSVVSNLPLEHFEVYRVYRSEGYSTANDTTVDSMRGGGWILLKK